METAITKLIDDARPDAPAASCTYSDQRRFGYDDPGQVVTFHPAEGVPPMALREQATGETIEPKDRFG
jgi:hypothetical protein